jgi:pyruvate/2-oxoacid:ferredoxin oxidoreductase beta subunit
MITQEEKQAGDLFVSGHRACHGCGQALAVRHILKATGKEVGCGSFTTT